MADQLPDTDRGLPRVIVAQRVIDKMVHGALLYPGYETGEAMVGLLVQPDERPEPDIYILDTISPGDNAVRQWGKFEQGSEWQGDVFHWLHINWEAFRKSLLPVQSPQADTWNRPLRFVGDWHKQPGDMIAPSGGDLQTARDMIGDPETPDQQLVAPIITLYPVPDVEEEEAAAPDAEVADQAVPLDPAQSETDSPGEVLPVEPPPPDEEKPLPTNALVRPSEDGKWMIRLDFWYISQRLMRNFVPVVPIIWPDNELPSLPPVAWHLMHPRRFDQEVQLLAEAGYAVDIVRWDADGQPPYEICFSVYKPGANNVFILVTPVDYPVEMPALRIAPLVRIGDNDDVFEKLYEASSPLLLTRLPDWPWDSKRTLIELVWHIEKTLSKEDQP